MQFKSSFYKGQKKRAPKILCWKFDSFACSMNIVHIIFQYTFEWFNWCLIYRLQVFFGEFSINIHKSCAETTSFTQIRPFKQKHSLELTIRKNRWFIFIGNCSSIFAYAQCLWFSALVLCSNWNHSTKRNQSNMPFNSIDLQSKF